LYNILIEFGIPVSW